jgi:hypothetical protein
VGNYDDYAGGFLWCMECNRCYLKGECRVVPSQWTEEEIKQFRKWKIDEEMLAIMQAPVEMCPYPGCCGDVVGDGIEWETVRSTHPDYPAIPVRCKRYVWF